jgi:hypothetical protein
MKQMYKFQNTNSKKQKTKMPQKLKNTYGEALTQVNTKKKKEINFVDFSVLVFY